MPENEKGCEHNFQHLETIKRSRDQGYDDVLLKRIDLFYCTKCLTIEERVGQSYQLKSKEYPNWY